MKFSKSITALALVSLMMISCKNAADNKVADKEVVKEKIAATNPETASFTIDGMTCPEGCAKTIEKKLSEMDGVQNAKVDFDKKQATVNFDLDKLKADDLVKAVETTGDGQTYKVSNVKTGTKA